MAPITSELVRRCESYGMDATTTMVCQALGQAVDAGVIELGELLDLVKSCATADELGNALVMLATTAMAYDPLPVGCPKGHEHRVFRAVGEREGVQ